MNITLGRQGNKENNILTVQELEQVPNAACLEIDCKDTLDFVDDRHRMLGLVFSKLRHGGRVIIEGVDLLQVSQAIAIGRLDLLQAEAVLYNQRKSATSSKAVIDFCNNSQFKLLKVFNEGLQYHIVAERQ